MYYILNYIIQKAFFLNTKPLATQLRWWSDTSEAASTIENCLSQNSCSKCTRGVQPFGVRAGQWPAVILYQPDATQLSIHFGLRAN